MNEHTFQFLLVLAGTLFGALAAGLPVWLKGWKRELVAKGKSEQLELSRDAALLNEAKERGKLEARVEKSEKDINGVAKSLSLRIAELESHTTAIEVNVTGKLPAWKPRSEGGGE